MSDSLRPHELQHARPPCPSPSPGVHSNSRPSSRWCHPAFTSSVVPFSSCPQSLPASESFAMSQLFAWGGQSTGVSALASFLPKKSQGWSPSEWTSWISLQSISGPNFILWRHKKQTFSMGSLMGKKMVLQGRHVCKCRGSCLYILPCPISCLPSVYLPLPGAQTWFNSTERVEPIRLPSRYFACLSTASGAPGFQGSRVRLSGRIPLS